MNSHQVGAATNGNLGFSLGNIGLYVTEDLSPRFIPENVPELFRNKVIFQIPNFDTATNVYKKWSDFIHLSEMTARISLPIENILQGYYKDIKFYEYPKPLVDLFIKIADSYWIAGLEKNWDDAGSAGCLINTWLRAKDFLKTYALETWNLFGKIINPTQISPDLEGGIDIYWEIGTYGLLINIPGDDEQPITYYGDDKNHPETNIVQGEIGYDEELDPGVLTWLAYLS